MAIHNDIGKLGEDIAAQYLVDRGFVVIERNFLCRQGEIDIICSDRDDLLHFVEVKSVSYETRAQLKNLVTHETWRPEDNVHKNKKDRLARALEIWIIKNAYEKDFIVDLMTVRLVPREKYAEVEIIKNILLDGE